MEMEDNKPYFFKIITENYLRERVRIPPDFSKHLSKDMSDKTTMKATIKGSAGSWPVKLRKGANATYLEDGWQKVMEINSLGNQEFLLFRYDGDMCFNLQIFDNTGSERITASAASSEEKVQKDLMKQYDDSECPPKAMKKKKSAAATKQTLPLSPQNPCFEICLKEYHVQKTYILRIPRGFSKRHFPASGRKTIILQNSKGEAWEVAVVMNQGAHWLSGGWKAFALANNLKPGDHCVIELVSENEMRVQKA